MTTPPSTCPHCGAPVKETFEGGSVFGCYSFQVDASRPETLVRGPKCLKHELAALRAKVEKANQDGIESVDFIRCMNHLNVPQVNESAYLGQECGACIAAERDSLRQQLADAQTQINFLRSELERERNSGKQYL